MKKPINKVLVINSGSSSLKYQLFDMKKETRLARGLVERIGAGGPANHAEALKNVVAQLGDLAKGIDAIGHRVLHGGEVFKDSALMTKANMAKAKKLVKFGPLHMPANLGGIEACEKIFKGVPNVGVFDTAFHIATMPDCAGMYAIDPKYYKKYGIRKYGFHGTSHKFITYAAAKFLKKPVSKVNLVTCHLGNGSSLAAIKNGGVVDTSMGLTPLAGMVMGTRCGDIDAAAVLSIMESEKKSPAEMDRILNKESGILGVSGLSSDMRDVLEAASYGNEAAELAIQMYVYKIQKAIGSFYAAMTVTDAVVMTAGIGENSAELRERIFAGLAHMGMILDKEKNKVVGAIGTNRIISIDDSPIKICVVTTDEEMRIARETAALVSGE